MRDSSELALAQTHYFYMSLNLKDAQQLSLYNLNSKDSKSLAAVPSPLSSWGRWHIPITVHLEGRHEKCLRREVQPEQYSTVPDLKSKEATKNKTCQNSGLVRVTQTNNLSTCKAKGEGSQA